MRVLRSFGRAALLALLLLATSASDARAHLGLRSSSPAAGDTVRTRITELHLGFTQNLTLDVIRLRLSDATGREIPLGGLRYVESSLRDFVVHAGPVLWDGDYRLEWHVVGADGHPVTGEIRFVVAGVQQAPPPADPLEGLRPIPAGPPAALSDVESTAALNTPWAVTVRTAHFGFLLVTVGVVVFALVVMPGAQRRVLAESAPLEPAAVPALSKRVAVVGMFASGLLALATDLRIDVQANALFEAFGGGEAGARAFIASLQGMPWMRALVWQAYASIVSLIGFVMARRGVRWGWWVAALAVPVFVAAPGFAGHAASTEPRTAGLILDALHVLSASAWLGALVVMFVAAIPALRRLPNAISGPQIAALAESFTPMALTAAAVLGVTGVAGAWLRVGSDAAAWTGPYATALQTKMAALAIVLAAGFWNWKRVRPRLGGAEGTRALVRTTSVELLGGALVLIATAVLVATPLPH
ncbi:MAG: copper resistance protein CopC/CopD [Gemmatimonadaceae bacterium]|nr:copper resistance protein CopC/CopD [Gemmatimonadaceae bacterium]